MANRNEPAFSLASTSETIDTPGLTKREYAAIHILAAMPRSNITNNIERAQSAIRQADALFAALDGDSFAGDSHDD